MLLITMKPLVIIIVMVKIHTVSSQLCGTVFNKIRVYDLSCSVE